MLDRILALARRFRRRRKFLENEGGKVLAFPLPYYIYIIACLCRGSCRSHPQPR